MQRSRWTLPIASMVILAAICYALVPAATSRAAVVWPQLMLGARIGPIPNPIGITNAGDGSNRIFVVSRIGSLRIVKNRVAQATPFLDITTKLPSPLGPEQGVLSVAFPPGYRQKQHFYVSYVAADGNVKIARYWTTSNPDVADPNSEEILLSIPHPNTNHNGGQLAFGPRDGYLYISVGDGGGDETKNPNPQSLTTLLGKILRIDVESSVKPYAIPSTNPFVANPNARHEIWAYGLRNPWRFSFDRQTGDVYIGDVGQSTYEEIDYQPTGRGGLNYGWNVMEGFHCFVTASCTQTGFTPPVLEYQHDGSACSVTGGYVYRGPLYARMQGVYFYADYCTGIIYGAKRDTSGWQTTQLLDIPFPLTSMGEDEAGNLYIAAYTDRSIYPVRDQLTADDSSPDIWYDSWSGVADASASGGSYHVSYVSGQTINYVTTTPSTAVTLVTYKGPGQGQVQVTIDGDDKGTLDLSAATPQYQFRQTYGNLSSGIHRLRLYTIVPQTAQTSGIVVRPVRFDAWEVGGVRTEDTNIAIQYMRWIGTTDSRASGGTYRHASQAGAAIRWRFTGTQFSWITTKGPTYGKADVRVDGTLVTTVDLYNATTLWRQSYTFNGFADVEHTVQILLTGTHNPSSTGSNVVLDALSTP